MIKIDLDPEKNTKESLNEFSNFSKDERENEMYRIQLESLVMQDRIRRNLNFIVWVIGISIVVLVIITLGKMAFPF